MTWSNKSLERTTAESAILRSQLLGGRRSAHRWAPLKAKDRVFQMSAIERRDLSILGSSIPVAVGLCGSECKFVIPEYLRRMSAGFRSIAPRPSIAFHS